MVITITNIHQAQAIAIKKMLDSWVSLGNVGSSRYVAFFADGDGDFHPDIKVKTSVPLPESERDIKWVHAKFENGNSDEVGIIDYDAIAWEIYH